MVLLVGVVPVKLGYRRSKLNRIDVYVAVSLLITGIVLCPISIFCKSLITLDNIYKFKLALFIHKIKNDPANIPTIWNI